MAKAYNSVTDIDMKVFETANEKNVGYVVFGIDTKNYYLTGFDNYGAPITLVDGAGYILDLFNKGLLVITNNGFVYRPNTIQIGDTGIRIFIDDDVNQYCFVPAKEGLDDWDNPT